MYDCLQKPSMFEYKFWPIFQSLKSHISVTIQWNATKVCIIMTTCSSYILV